MDTNQPNSLVIREHSFNEAKNSLKEFSEQSKKDFKLKSVKTEGGLFNLGNHKVTGAELNEITSKILTYFSEINEINRSIIKEFENVYTAFDALDKDYIAGIVASIKAAEEVSKQEQKDRKDIKTLVEQHEQSVRVLKKFKEEIEKLKHLENIDVLWDDHKLVKEDILSVQITLDDNVKKISWLQNSLCQAKKDQKRFVDSVNQLYVDYQENVNGQIKTLSKEQKTGLDNIERGYKDAIDKLYVQQQESFATIDKLLDEQRRKLSAVESSFEEDLDAAAKEQTLAIQLLEDSMEKEFKQFSDSQVKTIKLLEGKNLAGLTKVTETLEAEKKSLEQRIQSLTRKLKYLYVIAGGALAISVVQLLLLIWGVI